MIKFDDKIVLNLHKLISQYTGGSESVRDYGLLNSAIECVYATFDGQDLYPSLEEKAARIGYNLISNHSFIDGNKRIGMLVMLTFLEVNNVHINASDEDIVQMGLGVASGVMGYNQVYEWICNMIMKTKMLDDKK